MERRESEATGREAGIRPEIGLALAVALGALIRGWHVVPADFPLNDGGMFYQMTRDLQASGYHLPALTTYNGAGIPYAYSPLGFYLAAAIDDLTSLTLLDVFRWLPFVVTVGTVAAFAALARRLLASPWAAVAATAAFAVLPRSFVWLLMGGGLTRSLGLLFALLTFLALHRMYATGRWRWTAAAAVAGGLTALSHLGTVSFVGYTGILFLLAFGRTRRGMATSAAAGAGALLVSAPWWGAVLATHGPDPFRAAMAAGGTLFNGISPQQAVRTLSHIGLGTGESVLGLVAALAAVGCFVSLGAGAWMVPAWWLSIVVLDARQGATFATVPVALLAGVTVIDALLPAMRRAHRRSPAAAARVGRPGARRLAPTLVLGTCLAFAAGTALIRDPGLRGSVRELARLSEAERAALGWVAKGTPVDARLLVVANTTWELDRNSEWLPVLGRRVSVATAQGYEWMPDGEFHRKKREYVALQRCAASGVACLEEWAERSDADFSHVYVPKPEGRDCCPALVGSLRASPNWRTVYDRAGAAVFERVETRLAEGELGPRPPAPPAATKRVEVSPTASPPRPSAPPRTRVPAPS